MLATQWRGFDARRTVFIEDESHNVGKCGVPRGLWHRMRSPEAQVLRLAVPLEARVERIARRRNVVDFGVGSAQRSPQIGVGHARSCTCLIQSSKGLPKGLIILWSPLRVEAKKSSIRAKGEFPQ